MPSKFEEMFGDGYLGRPRAEERPVGSPTGDPAITEKARRRATRVLKASHSAEFEELMKEEAEYLRTNNNSEVLPVGEG